MENRFLVFLPKERPDAGYDDPNIWKSGVKVGALGIGCWAIGGPFWEGDSPRGYGQVDDAESLRAIQRAVDMGVTLFDTAGVYGCGHSERILGRALGKQRQHVFVATKVGKQFDEETRKITGGLDELQLDPQTYIRQACEGTLRRLQTDYIDLYQLHFGDYELDKAIEENAAAMRFGVLNQWQMTEIDRLLARGNKEG